VRRMHVHACDVGIVAAARTSSEQYMRRGCDATFFRAPRGLRAASSLLILLRRESEKGLVRPQLMVFTLSSDDPTFCN